MTSDGRDGSGFRVVGEQVAWTSPRFEVASAEVESPEGDRLQRVIVHHPGAVAVVPLHDDRTVTLVRQYRVALDAPLWEIPAGLRDVDGEPTAQTARRELAEEVGLAADRVERLVAFHNSAGFADEVTTIFLATGLAPVPDDRQGPEEQHMVVERIPLDEGLAMIDDGRITDAKTIIGLLLTARRS